MTVPDDTYGRKGMQLAPSYLSRQQAPTKPRSAEEETVEPH